MLVQPCPALPPQRNSPESVTWMGYRKHSCILVNSYPVRNHTVTHQLSTSITHLLQVTKQWLPKQCCLLTKTGVSTSEKSLRLLKVVLSIRQSSCYKGRNTPHLLVVILQALVEQPLWRWQQFTPVTSTRWSLLTGLGSICSPNQCTRNRLGSSDTVPFIYSHQGCADSSGAL